MIRRAEVRAFTGSCVYGRLLMQPRVKRSGSNRGPVERYEALPGLGALQTRRPSPEVIDLLGREFEGGSKIINEWVIAVDGPGALPFDQGDCPFLRVRNGFQLGNDHGFGDAD